MCAREAAVEHVQVSDPASGMLQRLQKHQPEPSRRVYCQCQTSRDSHNRPALQYTHCNKLALLRGMESHNRRRNFHMDAITEN